MRFQLVVALTAALLLGGAARGQEPALPDPSTPGDPGLEEAPAEPADPDDADDIRDDNDPDDVGQEGLLPDDGSTPDPQPPVLSQ